MLITFKKVENYNRYTHEQEHVVVSMRAVNIVGTKSLDDEGENLTFIYIKATNNSVTNWLVKGTHQKIIDKINGE